MQQVTDIACPVCGCVCDDLELTLEGTQVVSVRRACRLAEPWFLGQTSGGRPPAEVEGAEASLEAAMTRAMGILRGAQSPLIYGLSRSSTPGQRAAIALAEQLGACIDTTASICHGPSIMGLQAAGESACSLGEVRNRADLVIFWGCNPAASHPRHAERYSVFPRGEFVPEGRAGRTVVMVGDEREVHDWRLDPDGALPDVVIPLEPRRDFEAIASLRMLLKGRPPDSQGPACNPVGAAPGDLEDLVRRMRACRNGIIFFGLGLTGTQFGEQGERSPYGHLNVEALLRLVAELNAVTRFYARRMRLQGDVSGADSVLCWQTGFPFAVNLARGYPRFNPGEYSANELLERGDVDACLFVGSETAPFFTPQARARLQGLPTIALDYPASPPPFPATVHITTAPYGLHAAGTIYRMDEVPLPLRACLPAEWPTDAAVLDELRERLSAGGAAAGKMRAQRPGPGLAPPGAATSPPRSLRR